MWRWKMHRKRRTPDTRGWKQKSALSGAFFWQSRIPESGDCLTGSYSATASTRMVISTSSLTAGTNLLRPKSERLIFM